MSSRNIVDLRKAKPMARRSTPRPAAHARPHKRTSSLRMRRRKVRIAASFGALVVMSAIAYGVHLASYLPQVTIAQINVTGTQTLEPALIQAFVSSQIDDGSYHYISRSNVFVYPRDVIEHALTASFPRIKSARVALATPLSRTLNVSVEERQPFARWCRDAYDCFAMDNGGYIFASASTSLPTEYASPYIFTGVISGEPIGTAFAPGHMPGVLTLLKILQQGGFAPAGVRIESEQDLSVLFAEGFSLKASFGEDADTLARNLKLVLDSEALKGKAGQLDYIDLRFGNRVYYKLKGDTETAAE